MSLRSLMKLALASFVLVAMLSGSASAGGTPLVWRTLTLLNGWTNYGYRTPEVAVDSNGVFHFRGSMYQATGTNPYAFGLPPAYRPTTQIYLTVDTVNATTGRIYFHADGRVYVEAPTYANAQSFVSLDGVTYTK